MPGQAGDAHPESPVGDSLQLLEAYSFVFTSPNWIMNVLLGVVCQIIPIIGPIVMMGYEFEMIETLHRDPRRVYPDFDFSRFGIYLGRGLWPFLAVFCAMLIVMPLVGLVTMVPFFALVAIGGEDSVLATLGLLVAMLLFVVSLLGVTLVSTPMALRAGLAQEFGAGFDFKFIKDFVTRMWVEELIVAVFMMISSMVAVFAGTLLCCVGAWAAGVIVSLAQFHLMYQLYEIYLGRGGMPIPLKDPI